MTPRLGALLLLVASAAWAPEALAAQDTVIVVQRRERGSLDINSRVARDAVARFNRAAIKVFNTLDIPVGEEFLGDVGVFGGPLRIAGRVRGNITAINADVHLRPTADVRGDVVVIGGVLSGLDEAPVSGTSTVYRSRALVRRRGDRLELLRAPREEESRRRHEPRGYRDGQASIHVSASTYNRVEGLPIHVGPRLQWGGAGQGRFLVEAFGILRTAGDFEDNREDLGFTARGELAIGRRPGVTLGIAGYDLVAPIEDWQLWDDEIGWAALLWHRDYRDYFLRRGVAGYVRLEPTNSIALSARFARNEETSVLARDPWTPFRGDDLWRANPSIDEGTFEALTVRAEFDSRPYARASESGWYATAEWERGRSDDVTPRTLPLSIRDPLPTDRSYTYDRLFLDLRRYERIGWTGQLALRAVAAGTIGDDPLPIQRRLSLGGPDPLPGFPFRYLTCNGPVLDASNPALCDRILLFQAEYRGNLTLGAPWFDHRRHRERGSRVNDLAQWDEWLWFDGPDIVLFANAGTAWIREDDIGDLEADIGAGIEIGSFGVYGAKAVTEGEGFRITLRVHRRF